MLVDFFLVFLITSVVSFAGSLQPGPVNLAVVHTALSVNFRKSMIVAAGGVLPELIYSSIALWVSIMLLSNEDLIGILQMISILFLTLAGMYFLFKQSKQVQNKSTIRRSRLFVFGFMSGLFNPMLLIFWMTFLNYITIYGWLTIHTQAEQIAFIAGTAAGAFVLLYLSALITYRKRVAVFSKITGKLNMITGVVFLLLATWGIIKMLL